MRKELFKISIIGSSVLLFACSDSQSRSITNSETPQNTSKSSTVKLSFDWPSNHFADVEFTRNKLETSMGAKYRQTIKGKYLLSTHLIDKGLLIKKDDYAVTLGNEDSSKLNAVEKNAQEFLIRTTSKSPLFAVDSNGQVLGFLNIEEFKKELTDAANEWISSMSEFSPVRERVPTIIKALTQGNSIEQNLVNVWNREIGIWNDRSMEQGKKYDLQSNVTLDTLDYISIPKTVNLVFNGPVKCNESATEIKCVSLSYHYQLNTDEKAKAKELYLSVKDDGRYDVRNLEVTYEMKVTIEPDTLLPHLILETDELKQTVSREGYSDMHYTRSITNTTTYKHRSK